MLAQRTTTEATLATGGTPKRASLPLRTFLPVLGIFVFALALRLIGITWGLPNAGRWYSYHPDESLQQIVGAVGNLLQGGLNPHFFNYPSLAIYATYFFYLVLSGLGLNTVAPFAEYPWAQVRDIILAGRIFTALCGAGTAALVYLIAKELRPGRWAILAGVLAALAPGFLQHSHFATVDVPATFFVGLCLWLTVRAKDTRGLLWAAFAAGLAAGTKYNGIIVLVAPLTALFFLPQGRELKLKRVPLALGLILVSLAAFLITTPYALLSTQEFLGIGQFKGNGENGFLYELLVHPRIGSGEIFLETGNGWWYHFSFNMPFAFTWPFLLAAVAGAVVCAKDRRWWPLIAFGLIYFVAIGTSQVRFMRYTLLLVPIFCITAAYLAVWLRPHFKKGATFVAGFTLLNTAFGAVDAIIPLVTQDTRDTAADKLKGRSIALAEKPWFYTPPVQPQGFNQAVPGIPVVGFDRMALAKSGVQKYVISEFEWTEKFRLRPNGSEQKFLNSLLGNISDPGTWNVETIIPSLRLGDVVQLLPNYTRSYEPHDYLYTHPTIEIYNVQGLSPIG